MLTSDSRPCVNRSTRGLRKRGEEGIETEVSRRVGGKKRDVKWEEAEEDGLEEGTQGAKEDGAGAGKVKGSNLPDSDCSSLFLIEISD